MHGHVGFGAGNALALAGSVCVSIVEAAEPVGADIGSERPLTDPDVVFDVLGMAHGATIFIAVGADVVVSTAPCEVLMGVHDNVLNVIVLEEIVPRVGIEVEGIVEDELQAGLLLAHHVTNISVEVLKDVQVGRPPWLVDGLNSIDCWVITPSVKETLNGVLGPVNVVVVDGDVFTLIVVPFAHPFAESVLPMAEVVLIGPHSPVGQAGVIISVLRSLNGVDVKENLDVVLISSVQEPLDLVLGAFSAANVGAVGLEGPVTDGESDDLDLTGGHLNEGVLSDPGIPMLTKNGVTLLGSKSRAEGVLVHADTLGLGLSEEAVEEGGSDPGLKHLPATNVGADHGAGAVFGRGRGGSESCDSELVHLSFCLKL